MKEKKRLSHDLFLLTLYHYVFCELQDNGAVNLGNVGFSKRLSQAERLSRVNNELAQYRKAAGNNSHC